MRSLIRTHSFALAAVCAAASLVTATAAIAAPVLVNGNFDVAVPLNGTGGGWTSAGNDGAGGHRTAPAANVTFTNFFIINAAGQPTTDPSLQQAISGFDIGTTYRITGDYENAYNTFGDPAALSLGVEIVELGLLNQFAQPAGDGVGSFFIEFVANATTLTLRLTSERNGDDSSYGVDNIAVTAVAGVPEPSILGLLGLGMLGLAGTRRLRR